MPASFPTEKFPKPLLQSTSSREYSSVQIQYGDGYIASRKKGINTTSTKLNVSYILNAEQRTTLLAFFEEVGSFSPFLVTYRGYPEQFYILDGVIEEETIGGFYWKISFPVKTFYSSAGSLLNFIGLVEGGRLLAANGEDLIITIQQS